MLLSVELDLEALQTASVDVLGMMGLRWLPYGQCSDETEYTTLVRMIDGKDACWD